MAGLSFQNFLSFDEVSDFAEALAEAYPGLCKLSSIGKSREGREILLLTITDFSSGSPDDKPAYLIHGNIHAAELAGSHAALYTAKRLLSDFSSGGLLSKIAFYIVPRLNPDGAEYAVSASGPVRSRTERSSPEPNTLYPEDLNGDGLILTMRQKHPDGAFVADPDEPRLLIRRKAGSKGPFYRLMVEGNIYGWDGSDRISADGRSLDWNRNWSYDWRPEPEQPGAGDFPFSEKEMRCLAEFMHEKTNLFSVLGYHTGPAAILRPPSTGTDSDLDENDVSVMEDMARLGSEITGFPVYPVVKYHKDRDRDINLRGHFHNFGYHHLGLFVFEIELGTIYNSAGISTEKQFGARDDEEDEENLKRVLRWWEEKKGGWDLLFKNWESYRHKQLGPVEIGGFVKRTAANPSLSDLEAIAEKTYRFTVEHASRHPWIILEDVDVYQAAENIFRIRARIANRGELPTNISAKGGKLDKLRGVRVEFTPSEGVRLLSSRGHFDLGHLDKISASRTVEWFVKAFAGAGELCRISVLGGAGGNAFRTVGG